MFLSLDKIKANICGVFVAVALQTIGRLLPLSVSAEADRIVQ